MRPDLLLRTGLAFAPVCLFLGSLLYIDSYQLVRLPRLLRIIAAGAVAAVISYFLNKRILDEMLVDYRLLTSLIAPAIEEVLKLLPVILAIRQKRIGFVIDAAICGFAAGTGFALVENIYYLSAVHRPDFAFWIVRGFGTAVMHGGTTAIAAMASKALLQRRDSDSLALCVPGLVAAFAIHSLFNQFIVSPLASAIAVMAVLPPLMVLVFAQSEKHVQEWLGRGFDVDTELLKAIGSGDFASSRSGQYLQSLREHFDGPIVADMLCYLRLNAELALRAKGMLMLRETGLPVPRDPETAARFAELQYLKKSMGRTGQLALTPILRRTAHDIWQLQLLEETNGQGTDARVAVH